MVDVVEFLKTNKGQWFTIKEVSKEISKNARTVRSNIEDLLKRRMVQVRLVDVGGKIGKVSKYRFVGDVSAFESLIAIQHKEQYLRQKQMMGDYMTHHIQNAMIIEVLQEMMTELKTIKEYLQNATTKTK